MQMNANRQSAGITFVRVRFPGNMSKAVLASRDWLYGTIGRTVVLNEEQ